MYIEAVNGDQLASGIATEQSAARPTEAVTMDDMRIQSPSSMPNEQATTSSQGIGGLLEKATLSPHAPQTEGPARLQPDLFT